MSYPLSIITPTGKVFDDKVESLIAPGQEGFLEVLDHHTPMVTRLRIGTVKLRQGQKRFDYSIGSGVLEVSAQHSVLLLTDFAHPVN